MTFNWKVRSLKEWRGLYAKALRANWMQSWAYAQASFKIDHLISKLAVIERNGEIVGLMCVQRIKLGPIDIINLKRGPLWMIPPSNELILDFARTFRSEFPKSLLQRMRWMPEFDFSGQNCENLLPEIKKLGFKLKKENFVTSWLDLTKANNELRESLSQKWRNCLNKSERSNITIEVDQKLSMLPLFFKKYESYKSQKQYPGPSLNFLTEEFKELKISNDIMLLWALQDHEPIAGVCIVFQGNTAAYRIGWNSDKGRRANAHYQLLWKALIVSKEKGLHWFDLGGLLPDEAPGISHFKKGLGGELSRSITLS